MAHLCPGNFKFQRADKSILLKIVLAFKLSCILFYINGLTVKRSSRYEQMRFILFLDQSCPIYYMSVTLFIDMIMSRMWLRLHIIFDGLSYLCLTFSLFVRFPFLSFLCLDDLSLSFFIFLTFSNLGLISS